MDSLDSFYFKKMEAGQQMIADWHVKNNETMRIFREEFLITPEGQSMVKEKLKELREKLSESNQQIDNILKEKANGSDKLDFLFDIFLEEWKKRVKKIYSNIRRFKNYIREDGWQEVLEKKPFDLETIKQVPIETIMDRPPARREGNRDWYRCPFHQDKTPSFVVYKDQNRYHCFSCQKNGDVIALYQELYACDFVGACKALSN